MMLKDMLKLTLLTRNVLMPEVLLRYMKFLGTSLIGTLIDTLVLWVLSDYAFRNWYLGEYLLSPILSFQSAVLVNYVISYFYVWKDRLVSAKGLYTFLQLYLAYNLSCSTVFLLRLGGLLLIEMFTGWDVVICNLAAMCLSGFVNFLITNNIVFRRHG